MPPTSTKYTGRVLTRVKVVARGAREDVVVDLIYNNNNSNNKGASASGRKPDGPEHTTPLHTKHDNTTAAGW